MDEPSPCDRAAPRHRVVQHRSAIAGIEAVTLLTDRGFPRHSHDQLGLGIVDRGGHRSWSGLGLVEAEPGDCIMVNPGELHDGLPLAGPARAWRMVYLDPAVVQGLLGDETGPTQRVVRPTARDDGFASLVCRAHAALTAARPDALAVEEGLVAAVATAFDRHALTPARQVRTAPDIARALRRLDEAPELPTTLTELALLVDSSRFQLLRGFKREVGIKPHAYLMQRRLRLARRMLAAGSSPADTAAACGFADQSHLTRGFRRQFGVTPARYGAAVSGAAISFKTGVGPSSEGGRPKG